MTRYPPDFPPPGRATRCLMTPARKSAYINPRSASSTAFRRPSSETPSRRASRANALVLKIRTTTSPLLGIIVRRTRVFKGLLAAVLRKIELCLDIELKFDQVVLSTLKTEYRRSN